MPSARRRPILVLSIALTLIAAAGPLTAQRATRPPLTAEDIDDIAVLLKLEDTRQFDEAALTRLVATKHPEVRRRAIVSVGRIVNDKGKALLTTLHGEKNPELLATVAFATGQLKDAGAVAWLGELLLSPKTPAVAAKEAAQALGKIRTPEARAALARYLTMAPATPAAAPTVGEALLSLGRFTTKEDLAPVLRWTSARDAGVRWRAAWALFRPKDAAAVPPLMKLSADASADVRFWSVRGLTRALVDESTIGRADAAARLRQAINDPDRRVRTEAVRALAGYDDDASFDALMRALESPDTWLSVSVAESLGRFTDRAAVVVPALVAASAASKPLSLRITALAPLSAMSPKDALALATSLSSDTNAYARSAAAQALRRLNPPAPAAGAPGQGAGRGTGPQAPPQRVALTDEAYRALVTRWIVPDYNGAPRPRVAFVTPRGQIDVELFPGDAPFGVEYLMQVIASGEIVNTEFSRVVPNFVAQQRAIRAQGTLRDEVNRRGLTRGNLSWASSGLDTGRPGYTLGSTPQPHNEGDFTALGTVVKGLDVVDHLELGDMITGAKILPALKATRLQPRQ
ncbi:MAG: HEAT repeat domain-containing protein [Acidobacteria bacterium]|nr:HEAT repeat domain-containing protein [Acidobacteriota bacterium]MBP8272900.1 HEAT repeat domain-containing protein [Acidobacteriota bacterium]